MNDVRTQQLKIIRDEVWNLKDSPLYTYRTSHNYYPVLGEGSHHAKLMCIGEAPGRNEAETGRPFCGAAGDVLTQLLTGIGVKRTDVYITNIVKDRPPNNRDPEPTEITLYAPFLVRQIDIIQPKVIATLGRFSMEFIMKLFKLDNQLASISKIHGHTFSTTASYGPLTIVPLFHPAVATYDPTKMTTLQNDFLTIKLVI